jgi:pre-mRNA-splicing factor ATP-dependent RNA helicase DHX38/PRP16
MNPNVSGFSFNTKETLNTDKQEESGGLVVTKERHEFKKPDLPRQSLLGLDKLAAKKREEKREEDRKNDNRDNRDNRDSRDNRDKDSDYRRNDNRDRDSDYRRNDRDSDYRRNDSRERKDEWEYDKRDDKKRDTRDDSDYRKRSNVERTPSHDMTPSWKHKDNSWDNRAIKLDRTPRSSNSTKLDIEEEKKNFERRFYEAEEGGAQDDQRDPFLGDPDRVKKFEEDIEKSKRNLGERKNPKQTQLTKDMNRWEENQLMISGVVNRSNDPDEIDEDDQEVRVHLLLHDTKPPFLAGKVSLAKMKDPILPIRDATSDLALSSKKGSTVVREMVQQKERMAQRRKMFQLAGTQLGNLIGAKKEEEGPKIGEGEFMASGDIVSGKVAKGEKDELPPVDTRSISKKKVIDGFAEHMKGKLEAQSEFAKNNSMKQQREFLPVYSIRYQLMNVIRENSVVVIVGETGSGKTTQLTQYLHEEGYTKRGMVACTQPRRVAAMSVAKRVSEEMNVPLGGKVGYAIRFEDCYDDTTIIKYMTDGVLLRESLYDPELNQYSAIIMDEAHERSLNTDVLFGILRKVVARRNDLKLIVTSATLDSEKFSNFFGGNTPVFEIPGRTFPVEKVYCKVACEDYVDAAVKQIISIHMSRRAGDILVFMTGQMDIEVTCMLVSEKLQSIENADPLMILPIYSQLPSDLQARIFQKAEGGIRKCIVATNIAETSLTVDGIFFVVDCGFCKLKVYNPKIGMDSLQVFPVSQASANQRSGRAGRTGPGYAYRLFTERAYREEMLSNSVPEIQRTHLANVVLVLKSLGIKNLMEFDFMDPPPLDNLENSLYQLWVLGALDNSGDITTLGRKMVEFPLDPPLSKMLIVSEQLGCTNEVVIVVAMLSVPTIFFRPKEQEKESDAMREKFMVPESDHLTLLNVYLQWKANGYNDDWAQEHFVHSKALRKVKEIRDQLIDIMEKNKIALVSCGHSWDPVRKAVSASFFHHAARMKGIGEYVNLQTSMPCYLHPTSALYGLGYTPEYLVYHELVYTTKEYMQCVTATDPHWLAEMGPVFFSIREGGQTRREKRKKEKEEKEKMEIEHKEKLEEAQRAKEARLIELQSNQRVVDVGAKEKGKPLKKKMKFGI